MVEEYTVSDSNDIHLTVSIHLLDHFLILAVFDVMQTQFLEFICPIIRVDIPVVIHDKEHGIQWNGAFFPF